MDLERLKQINQEKAANKLQSLRHQEDMVSDLQIQQTIVQSFKALTDYLDKRVSKTVVMNQLKEIGTPDALKVVAAVQQLDETVKNQPYEQTRDVLSQIAQTMQSTLEEVGKLPKDLPKIPKAPEPKDYEKQLKGMLEAVKSVEKAVKAQKLIAEAPVVNVDAPQIDVEAPDLKPLEKHLKAIEKAVKGVVIPEVDFKDVVSELKKSNKKLKDIADHGLGGTSGGGGSIAPFLNANDELPVTIPNLIDANNSSTTPLSGGATFTGTGTDVSQYAAISVFVYSDVSSATDGLKLQYSTDGTNWDEELLRTYNNGSAADFNIPVNAQYFRVVFVNGATPQTGFRLQTILHTSPLPSEPDRLSNSVNPEKDAQLTKSAIIAQASGAGDFVPVQSTNGGSLKVSLEEAEGILGQATMANSIPVVIASDQTATEYATRISTDSGDANVSYIGKAAVGTATSAASWQIKKVDETTGTIITFAGGDGNFDNIWDNREALSYS